MDFKKFTDILDEELDKRPSLPKDRTYMTTRKNNGIINHVVVIREEGRQIAPSIHLDYYYDAYIYGKDIESIAEDICEIYDNQPDFVNGTVDLSWENHKDYIYYVLVNRLTNAEMLETVPFIEFDDLAMIFKVDTRFLQVDGSITIDDKLLNHYGKELGDLLKVAVTNTPKLNPLSFKLLSNQLSELFDTIEDAGGYTTDDMPYLFVASNTSSYYGASVVFYDDFKTRLNEEIGEDAYVLPSSVHETIIVPIEEGISREYLKEMVEEVNSSPVIREMDYLSNNIMTYSELSEKYKAILKKYGLDC